MIHYRNNKGVLPSRRRTTVGWLDQKAGAALYRAIAPVAAADKPLPPRPPSPLPLPPPPPGTMSARMVAVTAQRLGLAGTAGGSPSSSSSSGEGGGEPSFLAPIKGFLEVCYVVGLGAGGGGGVERGL